MKLFSIITGESIVHNRIELISITDIILHVNKLNCEWESAFFMRLLLITLLMLAAYLIYAYISRLLQNRYLKKLSQDEFIKGYRKAQLIDVREEKEYNGGHILGARNIPASQLRIRFSEIRKDKPVYLYCDGSVRSRQAARFLKRKGYSQLFYLDGGFKKWTGKIKKK